MTKKSAYPPYYRGHCFGQWISESAIDPFCAGFRTFGIHGKCNQWIVSFWNSGAIYDPGRGHHGQTGISIP